MENVIDKVWEILRERGIDWKFQEAFPGGWPGPKPQFLSPFFHTEIWEELMAALEEAYGTTSS